ncbi:myotubularin-related protein 7a isoform X2 [Xyrauchen texanus]|uniref:myotubularin-related protein 7a isoform X2 n=1 Tax=Xyrauchen texanus TaxID=154827 RepID=UPI002242648F|nr:myotubularin-related protein 7a isoform X2 [Xyrauchen texanus]XP_052010938.1 myotubularin-related protein 7a isoform X2 [Xyrauchen texanus]XP_052010939.1 myotubularin-related protein 7a isoform X2 [Xyrauchen texanus]
MEHIRMPKIENVRLVSGYSSQRTQLGTLYLTATHTIFVGKGSEVRNELWVLHSLVNNVVKQKASQSGYPLLVHCKNFQLIQFIIPQESFCHDVFISLMRLSKPEKYEELYCFSFNPNVDKAEREHSWQFLDLKAEYSRMGLPNKLWHVTPINREYRVCDTYPADLFVPKSVTLPVIIGSSKFRSRGRFPTLSYYCKENHATICRSSQPLSGFSARCLEDEQMLQVIMKANPGSRFMYVVDTRPKLNAMANRAAGKGYENEDNYCNIKFQFIGIENIHVMRNSQQKLIEVSALRSPSTEEFLLGVENSEWLKHIKSILEAGIFILKAVAEEGVSVLVHCSDGWDRTAQVCSVASVLLDPYYRTIKGLMVLIEKDWESFGHKFSHRYSHLDGEAKEVSPVIDQFLECVWQLMQQFPCSFEYNEKFLISIHSHIYSCHYGNFICNSQKEKRELCIKEKTHSIWPHLWEKKLDFMNPLFRPDHSQTQGLLRPSTAPYSFKYWCGLYNRFDRELHPRQSELDCLIAVKVETQQLEEEVALYEQKLSILDKEFAKALYMQKGVLDNKQTLWAAPSNISLANTPQDYIGGFVGGAFNVFNLQQRERECTDAGNGDQELGVAEFSCHSSGEDSLPSEDSVKDPDSDETSSSRA